MMRSSAKPTIATTAKPAKALAYSKEADWKVMKKPSPWLSCGRR
jgi:hypothetical protein